MSLSPGIYYDVPFEEYRDWLAINQSSLKVASRSMAHYRQAKDNPESNDKDCYRFGRLCHTGRLEPVKILERYVLMPAFEVELSAKYTSPKNSKEYQQKKAEFEAAHADKEIVTHAWYMQLCGILKALDENNRAKAYLSAEGPAEVSIVWNDTVTGLLCKARLDKWATESRLIPDLKTTDDAGDFEYACRKWGYHVQGAFYSDGLFALTGIEHEFCPVAVEKTAPFGCRAAPMSAAAITAGRLQYRRLLRQIKDATDSGIWPGYSDPEEWDVPVPPITLTKGGEPLATL